MRLNDNELMSITGGCLTTNSSYNMFSFVIRYVFNSIRYLI